MNTQKSKKIIQELLSEAGVAINGKNPWDITVRDERFYDRVLQDSSLGLGESYMDGWWECDALDQFFTKVLSAELDKKVSSNWKILVETFIQKVILNPQKGRKAFEVGEKHYDVGNDLFSVMLDKRLVYTCGYWSGNPRASGLDEAQEAKLDLTCRKLNLKPGMTVLDIGCGWGSFAKFAAEKYGARVTGVSVSKEQIELGMKLCAGLPVELKLMDYRDVTGSFEHIVSLGMFEHVGYKNHRTYMEVAHRLLKDDGLFLLHTIGGLKTKKTTEPWTDKYIFPNSVLPSAVQIVHAMEDLFVMEDWHNFSADYDLTLMAWFHNFDAHWDSLKGRYGERFYRMWKYYLLSCAGAFRARKNQLWQIVLSKNGVPGGYNSIR